MNRRLYLVLRDLMAKRELFRLAYVNLALAILVSCSPALPAATALPEASATLQPAERPLTNRASSTPTSQPTPRPTTPVMINRQPQATHTATPSPTITPTYSILRGQVLVRSNCRYGPGAPYLYKYGLVPGSNLEVIGRNDLGTWILVRAIGGTNPCWVKANLMDVKGDVMSVAPTYIPLPQSPYYGPLRSVAAQRNGDEVTVWWRAVALRAGDETASPPYLVEAWVCRSGKLIFIPIGVYQNTVIIQDEAGCSEPSHAQVLLAEKHGYTRPVEVPWPAPEASESK